MEMITTVLGDHQSCDIGVDHNEPEKLEYCDEYRASAQGSQEPHDKLLHLGV